MTASGWPWSLSCNVVNLPHLFPFWPLFLHLPLSRGCLPFTWFLHEFFFLVTLLNGQYLPAGSLLGHKEKSVKGDFPCFNVHKGKNLSCFPLHSHSYISIFKLHGFFKIYICLKFCIVSGWRKVTISWFMMEVCQRISLWRLSCFVTETVYAYLFQPSTSFCAMQDVDGGLWGWCRGP